MKKFLWPGVLVAAAVAVACGGSDHGPFTDPTAGGSTSMAGRPGHAGSSGSGGDTSMGEGGAAGETSVGDPLLPIVRITSPTAAKDPDVDTVVTSQPVRVLCDASASKAAGATIDTSTVKIEAFGADGKAIGTPMTTSSQNSSDANEFVASFPITDVPNGALSFKCSVNDKSTPPKVATTTIGTFLDKGPTISVVSPAAASAFALSTPILFKFNVLPAPLSSSDKLAAVDDTKKKVTLTVNNQAIDLTGAQDPKDHTLYSVSVKLNDLMLFPKPPAGAVPVEIDAWNQRGTKAVLAYTFEIDGTPPTIAIVSPTPGTVVGNHVTLEFTVTDTQSGVDPSTVNVTVGTASPVYYSSQQNSGWALKDSTFDYSFTTDKLGLIQAHVQVNASDYAANAAAGQSTDLYLDNQAPIIDLDPPAIQERRNSNNAYTCSEPFYPLGASPHDGDVVQSAGVYRALVWDLTNSIDGEGIQHLAGTAKTSVTLYATPGDSKTPLISAKGGTTCNTVASDVYESLVPIDPSGSSYFDSKAPVIPSYCGAGTASTPPDHLCTANVSDLTRVIDHNVIGQTEPVVYAIKGLSGAECTGQDWSLVDAGLPNGWVCLAAVAQDKVLNPAVSRPLRVCLNSTAPGKIKPSCAISSEVPPSCTDGCTLPPTFLSAVISAQFQATPYIDLPKGQ